MNTQKKNCNSCHLVKDASDFDRGKGTCKDCNRIKRKIRDDKNRTVVREKQRAYAQKNAEQIAERKHKWYEANKDKNIYIFTDNSAKEGNIILDYTSGLLKEPKKCVDADKKYDYSVEALPLYYLKKGDIFNLKANEVKGNMRIKSFEINDWVAVYYVGEVK